MHIKLSLEREVDQMVNDMMKKEGWTRSYALSVLRSKFETEERYQEVAYVNDLIKKESEEQEKGPEFKPITNTVAEEIATATTIKEPKRTSSRQPSKVTRQKTIPLTSLSKQLDKQTTQIDKKNNTNNSTPSKVYKIYR